jgi:hypothetical protein
MGGCHDIACILMFKTDVISATVAHVTARDLLLSASSQINFIIRLITLMHFACFPL